MPITNSSLTGVTLSVTSGNPPALVGTQTISVSGASVGANSVKITEPNILAKINSGDTITPSLQLNYASGLSVVSTAGTPYVPPPPPPPPLVILDTTNNVTLKYTSSSIPSGSPNPYIVQVSGTYYAVMNNSQDSRDKIRAYANLVGSNPNPTTATPSFTAPDNTPIPFNRIVTTLMTSMRQMLENLYSFNQPIGSWDTSNVTDMFCLFANDYQFNQDISKWNTSSVTNMNYMLYDTRAFSQDISGWIVTNVNPKPPNSFSPGSGLTTAKLPLAFR